MTPDEFREQLIPQIAIQWNANCFCKSPSFQKLLSFNYRDYSTENNESTPIALADSEILIDEIIRQKFIPGDLHTTNNGQHIQERTCSQCRSVCRETYEQWNINMSCSRIIFENTQTLPSTSKYLVGFYGLMDADFDIVTDFHQTSDVDVFLNSIFETCEL